jgi:DNA invertase Pin-like site-specific DNA recombinase
MKYILYARKSSESDERQIQSIDDQISYWKNRATGMGDIEISHIFIEEKSAKAPFVRPEFQKMIIELEKG